GPTNAGLTEGGLSAFVEFAPRAEDRGVKAVLSEESVFDFAGLAASKGPGASPAAHSAAHSARAEHSQSFVWSAHMDYADHPALQEAARHAFDMLRARLRQLHGVTAEAEHHGADLDAVCIWACVHGLATLMQSNCMARIDETLGVKDELPEHLLQMLGRALLPASI
ncbi:MAG: WHG domain-containing protein, partial [Inhella sp.]